MFNLKKIIKFFFNKFGFHVTRIERNRLPYLHSYNKIDLLFDVGANIGQYAMQARNEGYTGRIVSFEPTKKAYKELLINHQKSKDSKWLIHKRCALGDKETNKVINIAGNSGSSSILPMLKSHTSLFPLSKYIAKEYVEVITLDSIFKKYSSNNFKNFLKIDAQGYEDKILEGLKKNISKIHLIQLELSVIKLYANQKLYEYFFDYFSQKNFSLHSIMNLSQDLKSGKTIQFDATFVNNSYK
jgi:FkbM family methyltransferase